MSPIALSIAGSDSSAGAGIQADIKTFAALGVYGCSVITALTAQNTQGVQAIFAVTPHFVTSQIESIFSDMTINAVKVGMLSDVGIVNAIARAIQQYSPKFLVVDTVMVATSGCVLLQQEAIDSLKSQLIPKATIITPNLPEAAILLGIKRAESLTDMIKTVESLMALGSKTVLLKGGHLAGNEAIDLFYDGHTLHQLASPWINTRNTHGTGCTLSSAITALLAKGYTLEEAVNTAKEYISGAISHANELDIGQGCGPVHHFYCNT